MMPALTKSTRPATQWVTGRLRSLLRAESFDRAAWETIVAADLHVRIGNAPPIIGRDAALAELSRFLARIDEIGTGFCAVWQRGETMFAETEVWFTDADRRCRKIPCTIIARMAEGSVCDLRIHLDPSPIP
jgi:hypothetical protein